MSVSLDDFGTGYSSLTQLRTLPVDQIKLDRSFAAALDEGDAKQRAVVQSVVSLASALALDLVVEGIETIAERDTLLDLGARPGPGLPLPPADAAGRCARAARVGRGLRGVRRRRLHRAGVVGSAVAVGVDQREVPTAVPVGVDVAGVDTTVGAGSQRAVGQPVAVDVE